jgi:hypothetical protein
MIFELFAGSEAARRRIEASFEPKKAPQGPRRKQVRRRDALRSTSAAALRGLAERIEASPST